MKPEESLPSVGADSADTSEPQGADPGNFESSPTRFEYEVILEEYRALRSQIDLCTAGSQQIVHISIAAVAPIGTVTQLLVSREGGMAPGSLSILMLVASLTFSAFSLIASWYDVRVAHSAGYFTSVLRPRMERLLSDVGTTDPVVWRWEGRTCRASHRPRRCWCWRRSRSRGTP